MTADAITAVKASYAEVATRPLLLAARFYEDLFAADPSLRPLFPTDLTPVQGHFEAALALVIRHLDEAEALRDSLRALGAQHVHWRARPEDYLIARGALLSAIRKLSLGWSDALEKRWHDAITAIIVPMLEGAAVHTATCAEELAAPRRP